MEELIPQHAEAMQVEGFWVFLLFAVINIGLISWCFWLVKSNYIQTDDAERVKEE
jgi:multidrug resistance efflux pump